LRAKEPEGLVLQDKSRARPALQHVPNL